MPAISCIVPVYNAENFIARCIDSILAQNWQDFELILVNDGSPDRSGEICENYARKDHRIQVIHQNNQGVSAARNTGIEAAVGDYIMFVDSDDVIHTRCMDMLLSCLQERGAQVAIGELTRFAQSDMLDLVSPMAGEQGAVLTNLETLQALLETTAVTARFTSPCCKLYARELFREVRFPVGKRFEDEVVAYQLYYQAERIVLYDAALYFYFVNENGFTQNLKLEHRFDEYDAQWERMEFFREKGLQELYGKAAMTFLKTAQWDLITGRAGAETVDGQRMSRFEEQYATAFRIARERKLLDFLTHYDYYVLAQPRWTLLWRIKRQLLLRLPRKR